jgi:TRAP-type C4-dicarboxylate transport system permease small subunit
VLPLRERKMMSFLTHAVCLLIGVAIGVFACSLCVARSRKPGDEV